MTGAVHRLALRIMAQLTRGQPQLTQDCWKRRVHETEAVIRAVYVRAATAEPDTAALAAQMLDDEGHAAAADLIRELFRPSDDDIPPLATPQARTLASVTTGRLAAILTLRPRAGSTR